MNKPYFISKNNLIRIMNLKDINIWNYTYKEHMKWLESENVKNTFYYIVIELYKELNNYMIKFIKNDDNNYYIQYKLIQVFPKNIEEINKIFIKPKTKLSLEKYFNELGYKFLVSNHFGDGDCISIHF